MIERRVFLSLPPECEGLIWFFSFRNQRNCLALPGHRETYHLSKTTKAECLRLVRAGLALELSPLLLFDS